MIPSPFSCVDQLAASAASALKVKDEPPDFVETHCHWVGCDRGELGSQEALVKVRKDTKQRRGEWLVE